MKNKQTITGYKTSDWMKKGFGEQKCLSKPSLCNTESKMSILNVEHLTHGFGDRAIFSDVSFRLLKGEHIGLIGANGEGKATFMNIVTGQ